MFPLINKRETGVNLRRIMDKRGITPKDVQEYLGLGCVQSVYRWIDGVNMPTIDNLYALSQLLQVPIDEIVCGNRKPILPEPIGKKLLSCFIRKSLPRFFGEQTDSIMQCTEDFVQGKKVSRMWKNSCWKSKRSKK